MAQMVRKLPSMQETWVPSLGQEDPLEKGVATHSNIPFFFFLFLEAINTSHGKEGLSLQMELRLVISYQMVFLTLCHTMNQTILDLEKIITTSNISVKTFILFYFILFLKEYFFFFSFIFISWRPGKFHGQRSLASYSPWGHKELDVIEQRLPLPPYLFYLIKK